MRIKVPQWVAVLVLTLIMVIPPPVFGAVPFPFKTEDEVFEASEGMVPAGCDGMPLGVSVDSKDFSPGYWWRVGFLGARFFGLEIRDGVAVQLVFGRVVDGKLIVNEIYTSLDEARAKYPEGPCQFLTGRDA